MVRGPDCKVPGWAGAAGAVGRTGAGGGTGSMRLPRAVEFMVREVHWSLLCTGMPGWALPLYPPFNLRQ